jgi:glycosyltransferase involved in cell wall biosynthesis
MKVCAVIPALDEEASIGLVLRDLPRAVVSEVIVVDNGSRDATAARAIEAGATVVHEPRRGYGAACLAGIARLPADCDVVVFLDADYSDHPEEVVALLEPIRRGEADLVIGSRMLGHAERGALLPQARYGNRLACVLMRLFFGHRYTDLGPFRAITKPALDRIGMVDTNFGWTVEMQVKALQHRLRVVDVPVSYRRRKGVSKITGTVSGTVKAGAKILWTIFRYGIRERRRS